ncbi:MAG: PorP/SprF family type IX secretion system membrane protein [Flavobacteriales bacterium]|nr:PorP/SprF family type IX secretion system membrane protein [Flavobacteriales bacterium]
MVVIIGTSVKAQDFHLSQYDAAPLFLNPALVGQFEGKYRVHGHYRTQWGSVSSKSFKTAAISFDMPFDKFAFGAQVLNRRAGAGDYNDLGILLNGGYSFTFDKQETHKLSLGVQAGVIQKSINYGNLYFESQYTTNNGGTFDQSLPTGEDFGKNNFWIPDVNAGFVYYYGKDQVRINPFVGASAFHLTQPKETFYTTDNKLPMRYLAHAGAKVNLSEKIQFMPKVLWMRQRNAQEINYGLMVHYHLSGAGVIILLGPTLRSSDAFIIEGGAKFGNYEAKVSYDFNTSSLSDFSDGKGGFEISLTYIPRIFKPNPIQNCPRI